MISSMKQNYREGENQRETLQKSREGGTQRVIGPQDYFCLFAYFFRNKWKDLENTIYYYFQILTFCESLTSYIVKGAMHIKNLVFNKRKLRVI